jgi:hypothetical protein
VEQPRRVGEDDTVGTDLYSQLTSGVRGSYVDKEQFQSHVFDNAEGELGSAITFDITELFASRLSSNQRNLAFSVRVAVVFTKSTKTSPTDVDRGESVDPCPLGGRSKNLGHLRRGAGLLPANRGRRCARD